MKTKIFPILVLIIYVVISVFFVSLYRPSPTPRVQGGSHYSSPQKKDNNTADHNNDSQPTPFNLEISKRKKPPTNQHGNNPNNSSSDNNIIDANIIVNMVTSIIMAVFTFFLVCYNKKMWETTLRSVKATEKAANAAMKSADALPTAERAYLFIDTVEWLREDFTPSFKKIIGIPTRIKVINVGKTPAIFEKVTVSVFINNKWPPLNKKNIINESPLNVPDGVIVKSDGDYSIDVRNTIPKHKIDGFDVENSCCYCCGTIMYKDVFKRHQETGFCYEWTPGRCKSFFRVSTGTDLNYHT